MKNNLFFSLFFSCVLLFGLLSCGGDDEDIEPGDGDCEPWDEEYSALTAAAGAYAQDQTPENCIAYKDAYEAYLDAYREFGLCIGFTGPDLEEYEQNIEEAEASIDSLCD